MSWGAVGGAAIGLVGSQLASNDAKKATKPQRDLENQQKQHLDESWPMATQLLNSGMMSMDKFDEFWKRINKGDRQGAMDLLAPHFQMADQQNQAATTSDYNLTGGRSGQSIEGNRASRDASFANRNNALLGLKTDSVQQLGESGRFRFSAGSNLATGNQSGTSGLISDMNRTNASQFDMARSGANSWMQMGGMLGNAFNDWRAGRASNPAMNKWTNTPAPTTRAPNSGGWTDF